MVIKVNGDIIPDNWSDMYEYFEIDYCSPRKVADAIAELQPDETLEVKINSGGGSLASGQEIYSMLRNVKNVEIEVQSIAASAASIIAMAGESKISPVALLMIHNASVGTCGNHQELEKAAEDLKKIDEAIANAYHEKTGKSKEEFLELMEKETWITADEAVELGLIDELANNNVNKLAAGAFNISNEQIEIYKKHEIKAKRERELEEKKAEILRDLYLYG